MVRGAVQGVGFRPFVFRLASELGLAGWVRNSSQGVFIEVEGSRSELEKFLLDLDARKPPRSFIQSLEASWLDPAGYPHFEIRPSEAGGPRTALVLPDIATCPDCLREILDPANRRYFYPFTNCTNCGPRFSIIEALPYDRGHTSMKRFRMCPQCQAEYDNPLDRRFHAQPNACPVCGPRLQLWDQRGHPLAANREEGASQGWSRRVLTLAAEALQAGQILAVKGLGGFHLIVTAQDERAVRRLRERKHREEKPFALMFPRLESVKAACEVSPLEERLLRSPESPIVLLRRAEAAGQADVRAALAPSIAPGNPNLGVMIPYTPLHHLLLSLFAAPVVATSGNLSDEPICIDEREALERLGGIADLFLVHNRPILRHVDDSIVRLIAGRELVLRRARGYAPLPIAASRADSAAAAPAGPHKDAPTVLAVGAHLKNTVALGADKQVFISQHIGDLETEAANSAFRRVITDLEKLHHLVPSVIAADAHPDYLSTRCAEELAAASENVILLRVQHHLAHVLSCMTENELSPPVLGVGWDGTGYGLDGTIWGGEFFRITSRGYQRLAHFRTFRLPGGEAAIQEPRRAALGLLYGAYGDAAFDMGDLAPVAAFSDHEKASLQTMLRRGINSPQTSSVGRLFDALAALAGLRQRGYFEGQAAMELEFALGSAPGSEAYPLDLSPGGDGSSSEGAEPKHPLVVDWGPLLARALADVRGKVTLPEISTRFHNGLVEAIVAVAARIGEQRVVLSGGCFQNRYLTERTLQRLAQEGFRTYWHQRVPPNDGGISLGQAWAGLNRQWST